MEEAVRQIALGHLETATVTKPRVFDPEEAEGLHDFRGAASTGPEEASPNASAASAAGD